MEQFTTSPIGFFLPEEIKACMACSRPFSKAMFSQQRKGQNECPKCKRLVCKPCLNNQKVDNERVCRLCYNEQPSVGKSHKTMYNSHPDRVCVVHNKGTSPMPGPALLKYSHRALRHAGPAPNIIASLQRQTATELARTRLAKKQRKAADADKMSNFVLEQSDVEDEEPEIKEYIEDENQALHKPHAPRKGTLFNSALRDAVEIFNEILRDTVLRYAPSLRAVRDALQVFHQGLQYLKITPGTRFDLGAHPLIHAGCLEFLRHLGIRLVEEPENDDDAKQNDEYLVRFLFECPDIPSLELRNEIENLILALENELPSLKAEESLLCHKEVTLKLLTSAVDKIVINASRHSRDAAVVALETLRNITKRMIKKDDQAYVMLRLHGERHANGKYYDRNGYQKKLLRREGSLEFLRLLGYLLNDESFDVLFLNSSSEPSADMLAAVDDFIRVQIKVLKGEMVVTKV